MGYKRLRKYLLMYRSQGTYNVRGIRSGGRQRAALASSLMNSETSATVLEVCLPGSFRPRIARATAVPPEGHKAAVASRLGCTPDTSSQSLTLCYKATGPVTVKRDLTDVITF